MDRHNQGHRQEKREINDKYDDIYYIQSTDIVSQLHGNNINPFIPVNGTIVDDLRRNKDIYDNESFRQNKNDSKSNSDNAVNTTATNSNIRTATITVESNGFVDNEFIEDNGDVNKIALQRTQNTSKHTINVSKTSNTNQTEENSFDDTNNNINIKNNYDINNVNSNNNYSGTNSSTELHRVKRKSGKAAGAFSRPKGGTDSSSKSTSRKKEGKC